MSKPRFVVCPGCGWLERERGPLPKFCICRHPGPSPLFRMLPATVIVLIEGEPTDEQVEQVVVALDRRLTKFFAVDARAAIRALASPAAGGDE